MVTVGVLGCFRQVANRCIAQGCAQTIGAADAREPAHAVIAVTGQRFAALFHAGEIGINALMSARNKQKPSCLWAFACFGFEQLLVSG